ncbi:MAG: extracellular solute-binding protein [Chloroflexi bacterium]|nr:extracellular solute-binding protein [Chloroflexota bacterium]MYE79325.1 extracellular solute-binding protein [Chloroflexota bacterium]
MISKFVRLFVFSALLLMALVPLQAQDAVEIVIWHMEQPPQRVKRVQGLIDEFNAANPGIVVSQDVQSWGDIYTKAPASVVAGNAPDILFAIPDFTPIIRELGAVQIVDDFVAEIDETHGYFDVGIEPYTSDGHVWAIPLWNMAHAVWYNIDYLAEAGIEEPSTWDEWASAVEALTGDGRYGIGVPANRNLYTDQVVYNFMINAGASDIYNDDGSLRFNNEHTVRALDFYAQMSQFSPPDSPSWAWGEAEVCLGSGTCAMVNQFAFLRSYEANGGDPANLGVMAMPVDAGVDDPGTISYVNAAMILTDDAAKQEAAYEFLRFIFQPDNYGLFLNMEPGLFLPITESGFESETYWSDPLVVKYRDQLETVLDYSRSGRLFGFTGGQTFPSIARISAQNLLSQVGQLVVVDGMGAADAVAEGEYLMMEAIE